MLGAVQQKISCVFETTVLTEPSEKRSYQQYRVVATNCLKERAVSDNISCAVSTEKLDGTCVFISEYQGKPWLWARLDRKPNKNGEKRFRKFQSQKSHFKEGGAGDLVPVFQWDIDKDLKTVPDNWIPASGVELDKNGLPVPDDSGHTPGWVPVEITSKQHCWHLSVVDLDQTLALVLRENSAENTDLSIELVPMEDLLGKTAELIGTNINANPYNIGSKQKPLHFLVMHGSMKVRNFPKELTSENIKDFFSHSETGDVEGVVWHCENGSLYKIHRHHLNLKWPVQKPYLCNRNVKIDITYHKDRSEKEFKSSINTLKTLTGQTLDSICDLTCKLCEQEDVS